MFDTLSARLDHALSRVRGKGRLDERTVEETLREIRLALLEADVNLEVADSLVAGVRGDLVGAEVSRALDPAQQVVKAVAAHLEHALGGTTVTLELRRPAVIMLAGLQGSGKTTAAGKLASLLKAKGRTPMLVACDLQRPAAVEQLKINAEQAGVHVYAPVSSGDPVPVARESLSKARDTGCDVVIVDTAGRLHVDDDLLREARAIRDAVEAAHTLFVIDAMIGQEAVTVAKAFQDRVGFDGVILSKLDGDARGGAALSVRAVTGAPIMFASVGERLADFEVFHPDRMASRILGMGDVLTLIEKAEATYSEKEAARAEEAMLRGELTLEDFLQQMQMIKRMGPLQGLVGMMPGMEQLRGEDLDDRRIAHVEAIIRSMTPEERRDPKILNGRRRRRIATGSGRSVTEVNRLVKQFEELRRMMKTAAKQAGGSGSRPKGARGRSAQAAALRDMQSPAGASGAGLGGFPGLQPPKGGTRGAGRRR